MEFSEQYLTYDEYKALGGTIDQTPFNLLEFEARKKIDERTQSRLKGIEDIPQELKMCVFSLIDVIDSYNIKTSNKNIASESVDGYSISYVSSNQFEEVVKSKDKEIDYVIRTYLTNTIINGVPILYLGVK